MLLKFFLMYIGVFFGSSLAIMASVKKLSSSFGNQGKKHWVFNFVSSALASGAAFGATYISDNLFFTFWLLSAVFLLAGLIFILLIHKKYFKARRDNRNKQLFAEILFGLSSLFLCVAMFSALQYFLKDKNFMYFPVLLSMLFFFVPLLLLQSFEAAYDIPAAAYSVWQYPAGNPIELPDEKEGERLYVIGFEIAKSPTDARRTYFRAKAPEEMLLGDLYYHFINDYNEQFSETPIRYTDKEAMHKWLFRTKPKWYNFSKVLDPALTVNENKIKENTVIICERVEG